MRTMTRCDDRDMLITSVVITPLVITPLVILSLSKGALSLAKHRCTLPRQARPVVRQAHHDEGCDDV